MSQNGWTLQFVTEELRADREVMILAVLCCTRLGCSLSSEAGTFSQGPLNGGVSNGGVSLSGLVLPFWSFWDFPGNNHPNRHFVKKKGAKHETLQNRRLISRSAERGGSNGVSFIFYPFLSFLGLSQFFPGIFPICPGTLRGFSRLVLFCWNMGV